ncbi:MAG: hypothetical protein K8S16_08655 [Bacteroidales bacterium]|nr:hypothetical protein [Bacteroidales bacterium]
MKKRSIITILMVAIGVFVSAQLISQNDTNSNDQAEELVEGGGGSHGGEVQGIFVPD